MKPLCRLLACAFAFLLLSCGGGGAGPGSGFIASGDGSGVGAGGTGIVAGTVTGLGSVIVDGTRFDDSQAALERRPDLVTAVPLALADLQVGQYAYVDLDAAATPVRVRIASQLVGSVADVAPGAGRFTVWGQAVAINGDSARGPVTVLAGYGSLAEMRAGDPVQVYGVLQAADGAGEFVRATRIEKLPAVGALPARLTGTLQQGADGALLLAGRALDVSAAATPPALAAGTAVTAVVPWTATLPPRWQASAVALLAPAAATHLRVSGAVHLLPAGGAVVQGVTLDTSALTASDRDALREGSYLTVGGHSRGSDDRSAVAATVQALPQGGRDTQLRGAITAITGPALFVVRGQAVDASAAQFDGGSTASLAVGRYVEVDGVQAATGVLARKIRVPDVPPDRAVLEITGVVRSADAAAGQVVVQDSDGVSTLLVLAAGTALPAVGQTVRAEGYWDGSALQVRELELRDDHSGPGR
jgi:hypothetical protein